MPVTERTTTYARIFFGSLAAIIAVALCIRVGIAITDDYDTLGVRLMRLFSFFTIQSNILVCACAVAIAINPFEARAGWRIARLDSLIGIVVAGAVYFVVLRPQFDLEGISIYTNAVFHYIAPIAAVGGWIAFGPWHRHNWSDIGRAMAWPAVWAVYTFTHGAISGWYPYDIVDVELKGTGQVAINVIVNGLYLVILAAIFIALDNRWQQKSPKA